MLTVVKKDILADMSSDTPTVILHGCNCFHTMGAGIAKYLSGKFPQILNEDKLTSYGDKNKLGTIQGVVINKNLVIANCYTQFHYRQFISGNRHPVPQADYDAIRKCLFNVGSWFHGHEIRSPKIGCGLAGGDWGIVSNIFEEALSGENLTIYEI